MQKIAQMSTAILTQGVIYSDILFFFWYLKHKAYFETWR